MNEYYFRFVNQTHKLVFFWRTPKKNCHKFSFQKILHKFSSHFFNYLKKMPHYEVINTQNVSNQNIMVLELKGSQLIIRTNKAQTIQKVIVEKHWTRVAFGITKNHRHETKTHSSHSNSLHSLALQLPSLDEIDLHEVLMYLLCDMCSHLSLPSPSPALSMQTIKKVLVHKMPAYLSLENQPRLLENGEGEQVVRNLPAIDSSCDFQL